MAFLKFSLSMKWEHVHETRNPPSFTNLRPSLLISRYPFKAFLIEAFDFVKAGGSRMTTSYFLPCRLSSGRKSKTSCSSNVTVSCRLLSFAFSVAKETLYDAEGNYKGVCINEDLAQEIRIAVLNSLPSLRKAFQKKFLRKTPVIILITKETT